MGDEPDANRNPVERLAEEFAQRAKRGEDPSLSEYVEKYPDLAGEIRELFPIIAMMEQVKPAVTQQVGQPAPALPSERLGDFLILREIGRGGMGVVYEAIQEPLNRRVALKVLSGASTTHFERFRLEARAAARLHHTNIVPVFAVGAEAGRPYYAMQYIQGHGLDKVLDDVRRTRADAVPAETAVVEQNETTAATVARGLVTGQFARGGRETAHHLANPTAVDLCASGPSAADLDFQDSTGNVAVPSEAEAEASSLSTQVEWHYYRGVAQLGLQVAEALAYAHDQGILHRDIKLSNLLLDTRGTVWVADFGLAKEIGAEALTTVGDFVGTMRYMAPERFQGQSDPRSDVYSLGVTLYELLTLKPAFEGSDRHNLMRQILEDHPPKPRQLDRRIPRDLETIVVKAMAKDPAHRFASALAMAEELRRFVDGLPILSRPLSTTELCWRWCRRRPALAGLAAALVVAVLAGTATSTALWLRAERNYRSEQSARSDAQARYELAMRAIKTFHTGVSEDFLLKQDQFKDIRERLLRDAFDFYRALEGLLSSQADARSRQALARAYTEVGELTEKIGSIPEALATHRKALEVWRSLASEAKSDTATKAEVGKSLIAIGILLDKMGRYDDALASHEAARSVLAGVAGSGPARDAIRGDIARSYYWTGWTHHRTGKTREAMAAHEESRGIESELTAAHPDLVDYQRMLCWCYNDIGILLREAGKKSEALTAYNESLRIKQKIADDHPGVAEYRRDLAATHINIGMLLREIGKPAEALAAHEAALAILQTLADAYPAVAHIQRDLANGLNETGDALRVGGRTAEAQASYQRALAILEGLVDANPTLTENQVWLVQGLRGLGATQHAAGLTALAVATWRRAIAIAERLRSNDGETLYYLAGCHSQLGGIARAAGSGLSPENGAAELDRAMSVLRQAIAAGYRDADWMRRDPDLAPLRTRPDFQLLIKDLAFPADPFAR